jgi:hypothetical protein
LSSEAGVGKSGKESLSNTFFDIHCTQILGSAHEPSGLAVVGIWNRKANVQCEPTATLVSARARGADGVLVESGVVEPISSSRREGGADFCPVGGEPLVITRNRLWRFCLQIFAEPLYTSADDGPHPCDGGHDEFRATGAGNACASGTTTCWSRSADGSSTHMLGHPPRRSMPPRKACTATRA